MSFSQKKNPESFEPLPQQFCLGTKNATVQKNVLLTSRDRSVTGRGSEAYKQWNGLGVVCIYECMCICVYLCTCMCACIHMCAQQLFWTARKPQRCGVKVCLEPKRRRTATSLLWTFPREAWSLIYNKFQLGHLTREAGPGAAGELVRRRQARLAPEGISGMLMVCLSGGLQSPELGLSTVLWPSVEAQEVS